MVEVLPSDLLIIVYPTFELKIFILYKPYNFPHSNVWRYFFLQSVFRFSVVFFLDLNFSNVLGKLFKPSV